MARTCLETFVELACDKTPRAMPALLRDQAMVQGQVGQAEAAVRAGRAFLMETVAESGAQVFITTTDAALVQAAAGAETAWYRVEAGFVRPGQKTGNSVS